MGGYPDDFVVQEYIERPLLLAGFKFDIRCYMCIVTTSPLTVVYWPQGYCRNAMVKYSLDDIKDVTAHLTNVAIQRKNEDFNEKSEASIWSFSQLQVYLTQHKLA